MKNLMTDHQFFDRTMEGVCLSSHTTYCFQTQCPMKDKCIHYQCYRLRGSALQVGTAVFPPTADAGPCRQFAPLRIVHMAWGFDSLFEDVKMKDGKALRAQMRRLLGSKGQYYRYKLGQLKLLPEQQDRILALFASYGYTQARFDHYDQAVDLSKA